MHSNEAFPVIDKLRSAITPEVYFKHEEDRDMLVVARVVGEHVLIMGDTGTGKSTLSRAMAALSGEEFGRIQGDPSNTTKDIIGWYFYDQVKNKREFVKGPIHQPVVMIEEYNRNNPHTQSAFIQAMDEKQVTLSDGKNIALPKDQWIIATLNKQAQSDGVYIIDRPQLDRFGMSLDLSEPYDEQDLQSIWQIKSAHYQQEKKTPEKVLKLTWN